MQTAKQIDSPAQHTPGPWVARPREESQQKRITITQFAQPTGIAEVCHRTMRGYDAEAEANARLIAASPECLHELEESTALLILALHEAEKSSRDEWVGEYRLRLRARINANNAAITKATGAI